MLLVGMFECRKLMREALLLLPALMTTSSAHHTQLSRYSCSVQPNKGIVSIFTQSLPACQHG